MNADNVVAADLPVTPLPGAKGSRPTWEVAFGFPIQGQWTPADYFALEGFLGGGFRAELVDGWQEVLPMPKEIHQFIVGYLYRLLCAWVEPRQLGSVAFSGLRVRVLNGDLPRFREPDVVFMRSEHGARRHADFWEGADLAMEVVSDDPKDKDRGYHTKVTDYSAARIGEYWIVDRFLQRIRVLTLKNGAYEIHCDFGPGQTATSLLLPGFAVAVDAALAGGPKA